MTAPWQEYISSQCFWALGKLVLIGRNFEITSVKKKFVQILSNIYSFHKEQLWTVIYNYMPMFNLVFYSIWHQILRCKKINTIITKNSWHWWLSTKNLRKRTTNHVSGDAKYTTKWHRHDTQTDKNTQFNMLTEPFQDRNQGST